ncbi:START-like domain, Bet v I type allergen [Artemisia annua]|uniref:START-like domain, Bet v I type allergen n=1 Tax=Artemisia annua TaxID=35608 RepID=A0A2U1PBX0_ARTAN|nr:START-like domain, Bet v I type allergen [Artemisia annua]
MSAMWTTNRMCILSHLEHFLFLSMQGRNTLAPSTTSQFLRFNLQNTQNPQHLINLNSPKHPNQFNHPLALKIMGVLTYRDEHTSSDLSARILKASIVDSRNLMAKLLPDAIKSIEYSSLSKVIVGLQALSRLTMLEEMVYQTRLKYEKVSFEIKFEGLPDGGTISKTITTIHTHGDLGSRKKSSKQGGGTF